MLNLGLSSILWLDYFCVTQQLSTDLGRLIVKVCIYSTQTDRQTDVTVRYDCSERVFSSFAEVATSTTQS
jgi:hypothetical protein